MLRTVAVTLFAGGIAFVIDMAVAFLALRWTRVPAGFAPFTWLPLLAGTVGGAVCAALAYSIVRVWARVPDRVFFFLTLGLFVLSLGLPLRLSFTKSTRFAGVTPSAQVVLILMHAVVATMSFVALTEFTGRR